jgi:DeoR family transcriptional regulator of aga operon
VKQIIIPAQRRKLIVDLLREKGVLSVNNLSDATGVSLPTIRRDLDWLAQSGAVERSHGGASLKSPPGTTYEPDLHIAADIAKEEKAVIGRIAADRLQDNQSVIFDSSSTVLEAARLVAEKGLQLTAVTNDIRIGELFASNSSVRLIVCGGTLRPGSYTLVGEPGTGFLQQLHVDVAVMGIHGLKNGCCCDTSLGVAFTKRQMVAAASRVLLLVDAGKFGQIAFFDAFEIDHRFEIITDSAPSAAVLQALEQRGATVSFDGFEQLSAAGQK